MSKKPDKIEHPGHWHGASTSLDVDKLCKAFGHLRKGESISRTEFAAVIGEQDDSNRFHTVLHAFSKRLHADYGLVIKPDGKGERLCILTEAERLGYSKQHYGYGVNKISKHAAHAQTLKLEELSEPQRKEAEHFQFVALKTAILARESRKQIESPQATYSELTSNLQKGSVPLKGPT